MLSQEQIEKLEAKGGKYWEKGDRVYFEASQLVALKDYSKNDQFKVRCAKWYIDTDGVAKVKKYDVERVDAYKFNQATIWQCCCENLYNIANEVLEK